MMAVAAAQKNREMFAIKKSYSIEVSGEDVTRAGNFKVRVWKSSSVQFGVQLTRD